MIFTYIYPDVRVFLPKLREEEQIAFPDVPGIYGATLLPERGRAVRHIHACREIAVPDEAAAVEARWSIALELVRFAEKRQRRVRCLVSDRE